MKKLCLLIAALLTFTGIAHATPITFTDIVTFNSQSAHEPGDLMGHRGRSVSMLEFAGDFLTWKHQFAFDPAAQRILSATLKISLRDNERDNPLNPLTWEIATVATEGGIHDTGEVSDAVYTRKINPQYLADGAFGVAIISLLGDFYVDKSVLTVEYETITAAPEIKGPYSNSPAPVPEPGTSLLLGSGILGLVILLRKRSRVS